MGVPQIWPRLKFLAVHPEAVAMELVALDAEVTDDVEDEEILLHLRGEVVAGNDGVARHGAALGVDQREHAETIAFGADLERSPAGAVVGEVVAPVVEGHAVGVGAVVGMEGNRVAAGVKTVHPGLAAVQGRAPRVLEGVVHEDAALPVDGAVRAVDQVVGRMVRIGRVDALEAGRIGCPLCRRPGCP